ncbi:hypothetical protein XELAEV_18033956mg [Xenopus laevis]|uniref:Uncharacterized protein n=1 Tax=Xenopus laevis TaxID=8355 RepID=A0A974CKY0_XENLA|nr:hypothetical protein XELAEV_18033956mg [Xenopus laevis]
MACNFLSLNEDKTEVLIIGPEQLSYSLHVDLGPLGSKLVQNAAARLLTKSRRFDHISPVLVALHWLLAPEYILELLTDHNDDRLLRSSSQGLLKIPRTRLKGKGDCAFAAYAPRLWNNLPLDIRQASSVDIFKKTTEDSF